MNDMTPRSAATMGMAPAPPGYATGQNDPVFQEPWEAQAFAMTVALHQKGLFTWPEWAQALGAQVACSPQDSYYQQWLVALEAIVAAKGVTSADELTRYQRAWDHAAHRTPHGQAIELQPQDID